MGLPDSPATELQGFCCAVSGTILVCACVDLRPQLCLPAPSGIQGIHAATSGSYAIPGGLAPRYIVPFWFDSQLLSRLWKKLRRAIRRQNGNHDDTKFRRKPCQIVCISLQKGVCSTAFSRRSIVSGLTGGRYFRGPDIGVVRYPS